MDPGGLRGLAELKTRAVYSAVTGGLSDQGKAIYSLVRFHV